METKISFVQIALITLAAIILFKVFQIDSNQKLIRDNINKSIKEIESAEKNLAAAQDEIAKLEEQIEGFKVQQELLETQRDSIVLNYREAQEEDLEELEKIKEKIKENTKDLDRLRELNKKFERGLPITAESTLKLKDLIKETREGLNKYIAK